MSSTDSGLRIEAHPDHRHVLVATIDRPPVNAMGLALMRQMRDFFANVQETHPSARCIVLTGAGRNFCGGADLKEMSVRTTEIYLGRSVVSRGMFDAIRRCQIPTVAAVNGAAIGAGVVIASCCDIVLASEAASFALPEVLVGVMGGARHMARMVPDKVVRYLALTGRRVDARTLATHGGIQEVTSPEALLPSAMALAADISQNSPSAVSLMKEAINLTEDMPLTEGYRVEQLFTTLASSMPDSMEATRAFLEKRKPVWSADR